LIEKTSLASPSEIIRETLSKPSIFKSEEPLTVEYIPPKLPYRESQLKFLAELFRSVIDRPGTTSPKVLITGDIGTGKTVLITKFGTEIGRTAKTLKLNLRYIPINCREYRGSLFMILKRVLQSFTPTFPQRGFSSEELLQILLDQLEEKNLHIILALDEADMLIKAEGSTSLYNLTRIQEERPGRPIRLSLILVVRELRLLETLDRSTQSTLQRNIIRLERYTSPQLESILRERVELSFKDGVVPETVVNFVADMAAPSGDARYAIELLWRAGKYADVEGASELKPDHVRTAQNSVYQVLRTDYAQHLNLHEKLVLLGLARVLERTQENYATMGEVEIAYKMACEERKVAYRAHTQVWKYVQNLSATGVLSTQLSTTGFRGKTTLLGLSVASASSIRRWLESSIPGN
jgi:archaeal cell division control protein 6